MEAAAGVVVMNTERVSAVITPEAERLRPAIEPSARLRPGAMGMALSDLSKSMEAPGMRSSARDAAVAASLETRGLKCIWLRGGQYPEECFMEAAMNEAKVSSAEVMMEVLG